MWSLLTPKWDDCIRLCLFLSSWHCDTRTTFKNVSNRAMKPKQLCMQTSHLTLYCIHIFKKVIKCLRFCRAATDCDESLYLGKMFFLCVCKMLGYWFSQWLLIFFLEIKLFAKCMCYTVLSRLNDSTGFEKANDCSIVYSVARLY